ncbi:hypothetical protein B0H14DRAFT_1323976 [Mycena olivaceomarginata]|nr:hypothetical protein B0H14DRAFT_1323976 [Mycena olivaceomarginata]
MRLSNFLFSAPARVWNLRLLLLETIGLSTFLIITFPFGSGYSFSSGTHFYLPWEVLFSTFGLILLHHVGFVRNWPIPSLAVVDLVFLLIEAIGITAGFFFVSSWNDFEGSQIFPSPLKFAWIPLELSLMLSVIFRSATIIRSNGRFSRQRFVFLGACMPTNPPYTPTAILLNRSVARPLVRGESVVIIILRAIILSCLGVGVPIFGIYATIISPIRASVYTRSVATFSGDLGFPPGNITFDLGYDKFDSSTTPHEDFSVNYVGFYPPVQIFNCLVTPGDPNIRQYIGFSTLVECPYPWTTSSISINLSIPAGYVVTVTPLQEPPVPTIASENQIEHSVGLHSPINPIPLVSGSHLFGSLTWTQRETLSGFGVGASTASRPVFIAEITGLQPYPSSNSTSPTSATLILYQPYMSANKLQQDSSDVSPLSGLATFGGFWTFVNGAFALFFGANVVYFALGRRPLSALGLAHIFQRRTLARRWHDDFPALRTEGGQPGSESSHKCLPRMISRHSTLLRVATIW